MAKLTLQEQKQAQQQEKLNETVSKTEQFFNENKKAIWGTVIGILVVGAAIAAYSQFVAKPKRAEAQEQAYQAEASFRNGEFETALNGDGNVLGFSDIIDQYGAKAGKAVYLYAGVCELNLGNYDEAINYLKKYNGKETILAARAKACIGDAYSAKEDYKTAISYYQEAAKVADNVFAAQYLMKAGICSEELGDKAAARGFYETIKDKYPQSIEGYEVDKYINRINAAE